jgi:hypothetical protein
MFVRNPLIMMVYSVALEHSMKSPFPGMDPYLEKHWGDVHASLCVYTTDFLQPQLRPNFVARVDLREIAEPDAGLDLPSRRKRIIASEPGETGFVQIFERSAERPLVTVIEFLTLPDKVSKRGRSDYCAARDRAIAAGVNVVEIDLLRAGAWIFRHPKDAVPSHAQATYRACVQRGSRQNRVEYYPLPIRQRLPKIGIPLRKQDKDAVLDLQELVDRAYVHGAYDVLDYNRPAHPPLDEETAAWLKKLLLDRDKS